MLRWSAVGVAPAIAPTSAPEVIVSRPVVKEVVDYEDFTGHTEAVADVTIRARVTGYLDKVLFKEGTEVKQGDVLFAIDPRPYRAVLHSAEAGLAQEKATLDLANTELARAEQLVPKNAIAGTDYDQAKNAVEVAKARVKSGEAAVETAKLNLEFCSIGSPINGRISRQQIDPGNMVQADQTALTTIVSIDPIYAYFDIDERTMLRVRRLIRAGVIKSPREAAAPVFLGLVGRRRISARGRDQFRRQPGRRHERHAPPARRFSQPQADSFPRPVRAHSLADRQAAFGVLISEQAMGTDQGQKFVYVVNDKNEVVYRRVKVGVLQDGLRVVEEGLAAGDRVVVSGLQRIRPGVKIEPKMAADMHAPSAPSKPSLVTKPESASDRR